MHSSDEVVRAPFDIDVNPTDVFTQHTDADQLIPPRNRTATISEA